MVQSVAPLVDTFTLPIRNSITRLSSSFDRGNCTGTSSMALPRAKPTKKSTCYGEGPESALKKKYRTVLTMLNDVNRMCNLKKFFIKYFLTGRPAWNSMGWSSYLHNDRVRKKMILKSNVLI